MLHPQLRQCSALVSIKCLLYRQHLVSHLRSRVRQLRSPHCKASLRIRHQVLSRSTTCPCVALLVHRELSKVSARLRGAFLTRKRSPLRVPLLSRFPPLLLLQLQLSLLRLPLLRPRTSWPGRTRGTQVCRRLTWSPRILHSASQWEFRSLLTLRHTMR